MNIYEAAPHCVTQRYRQVARGRLKQLKVLGRGKKKVNAGHCATEGDQSIASG